MRDEIVDYVRFNNERTALPEYFFVSQIGISSAKFVSWKKRYGKENYHNGAMPRDYWLEQWEKDRIVEFYKQHEGEGYRRCTYMMMDQDIVYVSPSSSYRVLKEAGVIRKDARKNSTKGNGFDQPSMPHEHWHMDISNVKIHGVFYFLICVLDGFSRSIVHWDIRKEMKDADIGIVQEGAREKYPNASPRYITDNGSQFTSKDFKQFISDNGLTHWTTSPYYPQSNGKLERFHRSIKDECIKKKCPLSIQDAQRIIGRYVEYYNYERLHSSIGYVTPNDKLTGRDIDIKKEREQKLEARRAERKTNREVDEKTILKYQTESLAV